MDLNFLHSTLKEALSQYHLKANIRYKNIAFSSKNLAVLDDVTQTLRSLLPGYSVWQNPGKQGAPDVTGSMKYFQQCMNDVQQEGIIIHQPEQWLSHWHLLEKQAFWSMLGMWHDQTNIVLVFAESHEFQKSNNDYFKPLPLDGLSICLWRPARAEQ